MYIKFYNALGRDDLLAGRGQSPAPLLGHGPGQAPPTSSTLKHQPLPLWTFKNEMQQVIDRPLSYVRNWLPTASILLHLCLPT